ncbi:hypothetical protein [Brachybacterium sp. GPGPB12]|uniref:hypothetical protein n=1 Tax=Brachybacterium sp. GPGPB12 TaxID=3023517 RepID=UPI003134319F
MRTELSEEESAAEARRRAAVEDEPGAPLASYRRRLRAVDLPVSRMAWAGAMAVFGLALVAAAVGAGLHRGADLRRDLLRQGRLRAHADRRGDGLARGARRGLRGRGCRLL